MPYYVWRDDLHTPKDSRPGRDGQPLRKSIDVSFLSGTRDRNRVVSGPDYLHQCHTSISVTGWNVERWMAICLTDTFFNVYVSNPNNEDGLGFYKPDGDPVKMDAMSIGQTTADKLSIKDPRQYFFQILKFQTRRMAEEWENVGANMHDTIIGYVSMSVCRARSIASFPMSLGFARFSSRSG